MRVLVCDDEALIREFLHELLEDAGYEAFIACDGAEGYETAKRVEPDLVISDIKMPNMDGLELLRNLKMLPKPPAVIMLTGYGDLQTAIQALHFGAYDYMLKPVESHDLLNRLHNFESTQKLREQAAREHNRAVYSSRMAAVGKLSAGVAHEINNPTTFIRGNAQILDTLYKRITEAPDEEVRQKYIDMLIEQIPEMTAGIERGAQRITRITYGLATFANAELFEPPAPTAIPALLDDATLLLGEEKTPFDLECHFAEDMQPILICRRAVTQAMLCFLMNARQAVHGRDPAKILLSCEHLEDNGVRVTIEDSGPGVAKELRERIFEPFYTTRDVNQGAGLGLSMAYGILCEDHKGSIQVEDSELGGARFIIDLPPQPPQ